MKNEVVSWETFLGRFCNHCFSIPLFVKSEFKNPSKTKFSGKKNLISVKIINICISLTPSLYFTAYRAWGSFLSSSSFSFCHCRWNLNEIEFCWCKEKCLPCHSCPLDDKTMERVILSERGLKHSTEQLMAENLTRYCRR